MVRPAAGTADGDVESAAVCNASQVLMATHSINWCVQRDNLRVRVYATNDDDDDE